MKSNATAGALSIGGVRQLIATMREFRARLLELVADLDDRQMIGPRLAIVNPPLWEIGHVAWTQEFWVLRHLRKEKPLLENGDRLYNSTDVAHDTRWELLLPSREQTLSYMNEVIEGCVARIENLSRLSADEFYFYWLTTFHEAMHAEALAYTRQTLGYPAPAPYSDAARDHVGGNACAGDVDIPGGKFVIGAERDFPFVFDNEKWAHEVHVEPFRIARAPVTNGEFLQFVEEGGYRERRHWSDEGWQWLESGGAPQLERSFAKFFNKAINEPIEVAAFKERLDHPVYWQRIDNGRWEQRVYDRYVLLNENLPVVHISWYEAEAFCRWAGRRLPTEVEWEVAASGEFATKGTGLSERRRLYPWGDQAPSAETANLDWRAGGLVEVGAYAAGDSTFGCRQMIGNVWEWTADTFQPYPGFTVDPYKEYSKPWFGTHKVLRGGCWATSSLLIRNTWRNFYTPDRRDVWAGFRTCAK
ncbi:MAG TPA: selenoneine synthase SenA [Candidatus Binatia bacterium]|nr:selenoneine synthase SenA [Candidatus Binatia bacterium]